MDEKSKELVLASLPQNIHQVERFVEDLCDHYNINNTYFGNILLSLTEAVNNAIIHGNGNNPEKKVRVLFEQKPVGLTFKVTDEGEGFDFEHVPNPLDVEEDQQAKAGTGLFLIRTLADEVRFTENGSSIEIIFKISSINYEASAERVKKLKSYFRQVGVTAEKGR